jgi:hypothetical protein
VDFEPTHVQARTPQPAWFKPVSERQSAKGVPAHIKRRAQLALTTNVQSLRLALFIARKRVDDAETIDWPALAASWQIDVDLISARLEGLTA